VYRALIRLILVDSFLLKNWQQQAFLYSKQVEDSANICIRYANIRIWVRNGCIDARNCLSSVVEY
jgi:hypothetical protein